MDSIYLGLFFQSSWPLKALYTTSLVTHSDMVAITVHTLTHSAASGAVRGFCISNMWTAGDGFPHTDLLPPLTEAPRYIIVCCLMAVVSDSDGRCRASWWIFCLHACSVQLLIKLSVQDSSDFLCHLFMTNLYILQGHGSHLYWQNVFVSSDLVIFWLSIHYLLAQNTIMPPFWILEMTYLAFRESVS